MAQRKVLTHTKYAPYIIKFIQLVRRTNFETTEAIIPFPNKTAAYRALMGLNAARRHMITADQSDGLFVPDSAKLYIKLEDTKIIIRWDDPADEFPMFAVGPDGSLTAVDASDITHGQVRTDHLQRMMNPDHKDPIELPMAEDHPIDPEAFVGGLFDADTDPD